MAATSRTLQRERAPVMRKFGMLFQGGALFDSLTVWENIAFRLIYADGVPRTERASAPSTRCARSASRRSSPTSSPIELSGGMQKRAGLARAIIAKPEIIFFDEPTTGLDPITADAINDLIVEMVKDLGCAAVSITHDMALRAQNRRRNRHAPRWRDRLARPGERTRFKRQRRWSISSSPAARTGRFRLWCDGYSGQRRALTPRGGCRW